MIAMIHCVYIPAMTSINVCYDLGQSLLSSLSKICLSLMVVRPERDLETTLHQMLKTLCLSDGMLKGGNKIILSSCFMVENVLVFMWLG